MPIALQFLASVIIWGSTWLVITTQLTQGSAAWVVCYRTALGALLLHLIGLATRQLRRLSARQHLLMAVFGIFQFSINYIAVYEAERLVPSGLVAAAFSLMVVFSPLAGLLILRQRVARLTWVGGLVAVAGVVLLFLPDVTAMKVDENTLLGLALCAGAAAWVSIGNIVPTAQGARGISAFALNAWGMTWGAALTALVASLRDGPPFLPTGATFWAGMAYLVIFGSIIAFLFLVNVIRAWGVARASYTSVLIPLMALGLSTVFEGYRWTLDALVGAALILAGLVITLSARRRHH